MLFFNGILWAGSVDPLTIHARRSIEPICDMLTKKLSGNPLAWNLEIAAHMSINTYVHIVHACSTNSLHAWTFLALYYWGYGVGPWEGSSLFNVIAWLLTFIHILPDFCTSTHSRFHAVCASCVVIIFPPSSHKLKWKRITYSVVTKLRVNKDKGICQEQKLTSRFSFFTFQREWESESLHVYYSVRACIFAKA